MAYTDRVWTTDTAASLDAADFDGQSTVTSNQTDYVIDNLTATVRSETDPLSSLMRVDSGTVNIAFPECIIGNQNVNTASGTGAQQRENNTGLWVNGGTLTILGSANENDPHTFLKIDGETYNPGNNGPFHTASAGIALTEGSVNIGTANEPFCKIVSSKGLTVDPDGGDLGHNDENTGDCRLNVQTLLIHNPHQDGVPDAQLATLGFRTSATGYVANGSSFNTAILDGCNILDVSGAFATNAGMLPQNVVFRRGSFVGDNGGLDEGRGNNALGFGYVGADGNTAAQEFIINTTNTGVTGLANSNWFVIGNSDVEMRASARFDGRFCGLVGNRLVTLTGETGGNQSYYIPETTNRFVATQVSSVDDVSGQTDLGGYDYTPTGVTATNAIPIGGTAGRFSVTGTTSATPITLRMVQRFQTGSGTTIESVSIHQDNEYVYFGNVDLTIGVRTLNYYQGGVQDLTITIPDATDPIIDTIKGASIATTSIPGATVTLPVLGGATTLPTTVTLNEATDVTFTVSQVLSTIKNALVTRLNTGENTTTLATAEQYVENWLDNIVNGTSPLTIDNGGVGEVSIDVDAAYTISDIGGDITFGTNVVQVIELAIVDNTPAGGLLSVYRDGTLEANTALVPNLVEGQVIHVVKSARGRTDVYEQYTVPANPVSDSISITNAPTPYPSATSVAAGLLTPQVPAEVTHLGATRWVMNVMASVASVSEGEVSVACQTQVKETANYNRLIQRSGAVDSVGSDGAAAVGNANQEHIQFIADIPATLGYLRPSSTEPGIDATSQVLAGPLTAGSFTPTGGSPTNISIGVTMANVQAFDPAITGGQIEGARISLAGDIIDANEDTEKWVKEMRNNKLLGLKPQQGGTGNSTLTIIDADGNNVTP